MNGAAQQLPDNLQSVDRTMIQTTGSENGKWLPKCHKFAISDISLFEMGLNGPYFLAQDYCDSF